MTAQIDVWFALTFLIVGLSHAIRPGLWVEFFHALKRTGQVAPLIAMYTLPIGLMVVVAHNIWVRDWPVLVTVVGWGMTIKSTIYFLFPSIPNRLIDNVGRWERSFGVFRVVGVAMCLMGAALAWHAIGRLPSACGARSPRGWFGRRAGQGRTAFARRAPIPPPFPPFPRPPIMPGAPGRR